MDYYRNAQNGQLPVNMNTNLSTDANLAVGVNPNMNGTPLHQQQQQQQQAQSYYTSVTLNSNPSNVLQNNGLSNTTPGTIESGPPTANSNSINTAINPPVPQSYTSNMNYTQFTTSQISKPPKQLEQQLQSQPSTQTQTQTQQQIPLLPNQIYRHFYSQEVPTNTLNYQLNNQNPTEINDLNTGNFSIRTNPGNTMIQSEPHNDTPSSSGSFASESGSIKKTLSKNNDNPRSAKKRVARACDHCRKRKIKCDEKRDPKLNKCSNCIRYNADCVFKNHEQNDSNNAISSNSQKMIKTESNNFKFKKNQTKWDTPSPITYTSPESVTKSTNNKIEKLDKKVSLLTEHISKLEELLIQIANQIPNPNNKKQENDNYSKDENLTNRNLSLAALKKDEQIEDETKNELICTSRVYSTSLLTTQKLIWMIYRLGKGKKIKETTVEGLINPIKDILSVSLKWYVLQSKKLMDFSSPLVIDNKLTLRPLPSKEQCKRLLENFRATALSSITSIIGLDECLAIADKYYDVNYGSKKLSYSELLLLNICISSGASITQMMKTSDYYIRKDKFDPNKIELKTIESDCLLNAMYYYNKVTILSEGFKTLQALLLLSSYLQTNVNIEVALGVLETAIRYVLKMGLHKQSFYENLPISDVMTSRAILWRCYSKDKSFALMLNKPPLILPSQLDMMSSNTYLEVITDLIKQKGSERDIEEVSKITNIYDALNYIIRYSEYVPLFISYFASILTEIETDMYMNCFSVRSFSNKNFGDNLETILKLRSSLISWEESLHPCIDVKTYKQCLSTLYVQTFDGNPALYFEVACFRVLGCHFHYYYLRVILGLLGTSYLINNYEILLDSNYDIVALYNLFRNDSLQCSIKMLELFQTFDYQPYVNDEIIYYFFTGVYVILFYIVEHSGDKSNDTTLNLIHLLQATHAHIIGDNEESLTSDNMKWNVGLFFYTYMLQQLIKYFEVKDSVNCNLDIDITPYTAMLNKILDYSKDMKNHVADKLYQQMKNYHCSPYGDPSEFESDTLEGDEEALNKIGTPSITIFRELKKESLILLKSEKPFLSIGYSTSVPNTPKPGAANIKSIYQNDQSIYTVEPKNFTDLLKSLNPSHSANDGFNDFDDSLSLEDDINDCFQAEFLDPFWYNQLFYDREFFFSETIIDRAK